MISRKNILIGLDEILDKYIDPYERSQINTSISENDTMFTQSKSIDEYLLIGSDALNAIAKGMILSSLTQVDAVLDLPCGHGRILRHLVNFFQGCKITACDIDQDGVNFCRETFGVESVYSNENFDIDFNQKFDVIWCGSLLTHLPENLFSKALNFLVNSLSDKGIVVLTLHGRFSIWLQHNQFQYLPDESFSIVENNFNDNGFGYTDYKGHKNLGLTLSAPSYNLRLIEKIFSIRVISYQERGWAGHQDVLILGKPPINLPFNLN